MAVSESESYQDQWLFYHEFYSKGLIQYRYMEFADTMIYQWFPSKIQELYSTTGIHVHVSSASTCAIFVLLCFCYINWIMDY